MALFILFLFKQLTLSVLLRIKVSFITLFQMIFNIFHQVIIFSFIFLKKIFCFHFLLS